MSQDSLSSIPAKPRVLIADDSRIVRTALIKRIQGLFEFREAIDGEQAWETLLLDPAIRVVITDLSMPKLDGYELLARIRGSRLRRIRELPVVVVSGSDEQEERARARAAGATDLITKGIATPQLLSRLEVLSSLVVSQREFERGLEALVRDRAGSTLPLLGEQAFMEAATQQLDGARANRLDLVVLEIGLGIRHQGLDGFAAVPPAAVLEAIGQLLRRTVRQEDLVARTADARFSLVADSLGPDAARRVAQRICHAIAGASLAGCEQTTLIACCGLAALSDFSGVPHAPDIRALRGDAHRRALLGLDHGLTGVVGLAEEQAFRRGESRLEAALEPDLATLLRWAKEGRHAELTPHLARLSSELAPLVELLQQQVPLR
ncbi:MAG TPA: response regulator [Noviherbaspirillum sp.]|nr:response regulator [Noviherbaspirillum sp.]